ncbi:MAG TPA: squalene/phytoene synthase family protein [Thermoanaerobaculia bacterium]|nr:squalene/phytoene synthase family protein [Thermoanaerobaculia bacterium]
MSGPADRPTNEEWRADALARSPHSRLDQEVRRPDEDFDADRALALCAEITRNLLGDFAPALVLLPVPDRQRVQALLAYTFTLFDFARQRGAEGERLAQINRWQFTLEAALTGQPVGQPVFVRMEQEQRRRAWPTEALDEIAACARRRATRPRPATPEEADADADRLARAVTAALLGETPAAEVNAFTVALVRLRSLQSLGSEIEGRRNPFPLSEMPEEWQSSEPAPRQLLEAAKRECGRIRPRLLRAPRGLLDLPGGYRHAAVFCLLAALHLLTKIEQSGEELLRTPPQIGIVARLALLLRARWFRVG